MMTLNIMTLSITTLGIMLHFGIKTFSITIKNTIVVIADTSIMVIVVMLGVDMRSVTFLSLIRLP